MVKTQNAKVVNVSKVKTKHALISFPHKISDEKEFKLKKRKRVNERQIIYRRDFCPRSRVDA